MTTPDRSTDAGSRAVSRRTFLAGSAAAGVAAAAGLEGILAARRAPAFAQGTRLNIVRWVDFIPACDVELKRQAGEASKALGAEVVFEFINANDLQARITAAMQSGAGPDIIQMLHNWPHLYANGLVDVSDLAGVAGEGAGRALRAVRGLHQGRRQVPGPAPRHRPGPHRLPQVVVRRGRRHRPSPRRTRSCGRSRTKLKKKGKPYGQTLGHTFGDAPGWAYPLMWNFGGHGDRQGRQDRHRQPRARWRRSSS